MNKLIFYCTILSLIRFSAFAEKKIDPIVEIGFHSYNLSLENKLNDLNGILSQQNFPSIKTMSVQCGTLTLNSIDQKQSMDIKLGGSYQILEADSLRTKLQNIVLIVEYRYNIFLRNRHWVFFPAIACGTTLGKLSLIQIHQDEMQSGIENFHTSDYLEKSYPFSTVFIHPKVGMNYQFKINWFKSAKFSYSVGFEVGYQWALNAKFHSANRGFLYTNAPKFNLSSFTFGLNLKMKLPRSA